MAIVSHTSSRTQSESGDCFALYIRAAWTSRGLPTAGFFMGMVVTLVINPQASSVSS